MKRGKKYKAAAALVDKEKLYTIEEAVALVKQTSTTKFDATIDVSFRLNVDPRHADQQIRGTLVLPHGNGKEKTVLVITNSPEAAKEAGADFVGGKDMIEKIKSENWFGYDVIVATPDMMGELGKLGRLLGPKGLMPNPKTGTVTTDVAKAVQEIKAGKVEYRVDREANMHVSIGRVSFEDEKLIDNLNALTERIVRVRPAAVKGTFIKNAVIHTTMGPSIKITFPGR
ncbi:MAG: 50S ribosomal protein L1 [Bacilli bacterium]|jgi:large subunit ribosomal protein L1|nr:50S ribosomal protein L1 [Bacillota bacterium]NLI52408.1 50S ribosomal protein L1 [Erysipelotrichaceae bacterium]OQC49896.1 MAG: 50S ribosomal protein L1 [Tenericutes bacterium ADurb.Bin024]HOA10864.1 50S ribosomal protein L1 [Bacilli bacterium]TAH59478.1 MAG: 50S ribosomal protein L1 [Bacillota bacterium]